MYGSSFGAWGAKSQGMNSTYEDDIDKYKDIQSNSRSISDHAKRVKQTNSDYQKHLQGKYNQDFTDKEAEYFGKKARRAAFDESLDLGNSNNIGNAADSSMAFQAAMKMKQADALRSAGHWTAEPGLHTGYGFGMVGSFKADYKSDWNSFRKDTLNVGKEGIMNSMGFMTEQQKMSFESSKIAGRLMQAANPLASAAVIGSGILEGQSPDEIVTEQFAQGAAFTGFIAGNRLAGAATGFLGRNLKTSTAATVGKGAARLMGGLTGAAFGYAAVSGTAAVVSDLSDAESAIGSTMYKSAARDVYGDLGNTRATLTARQKALQQVNSSVFNDRGFTLGNEASILRNVSL